jgi:AraC family transcriptional regulator, transcriptional activator of pobA
MKFHTENDEQIFVSEIVPERSYMFNQDLKTGLTVVWNTGRQATFTIDGEPMILGKNCIIFLTEFHQIQGFEFERMNIIQFNRTFYCVRDDDDEVGCRGVLFFGASDIPKIVISKDNLSKFDLMWNMFVMEMEEQDDLKLVMLRTMLKRFLIMCLRSYKREGTDLPADNANVGIIREFNYLVEQKFRTHTTVNAYAKMLNKSPKTLSNIFTKFIDQSPLQIIQNRRLLEAKRLLMSEKKSVKEIAFELGFSDIQAFSHFFRKSEGRSPSEFREA